MPKTEPAVRWRSLIDLPDAVSGLGLAAGLGALYAGTVHRNFALAFALLFASGAADLLDGAVARMTGRGRPFGGYFDCMVDTIVFLPVVSVLVYQLGMTNLFLHFAFNSCGALRHARLLAHPHIKRLGIPSTVAGFAFPVAYAAHDLLGVDVRHLFTAVMVVLSVGMVSLMDLRFPRPHPDADRPA
jgi:phosphatidylserine synthase